MKTTTSFDSAGRLGTVARENGDTWGYGYTSGSSRIHTVGFSGSGVTAHTAVREYDSIGRVKSIRYQRGNSSATWASNRLIGWTYGYKSNSPCQRETAEPYAPTGSPAGADEPNPMPNTCAVASAKMSPHDMGLQLTRGDPNMAKYKRDDGNFSMYKTVDELAKRLEEKVCVRRSECLVRPVTLFTARVEKEFRGLRSRIRVGVAPIKSHAFRNPDNGG